MKFTRVDQVAAWRLCVGCGACKYICPEKNISLVDIANDGIRPILGWGQCRQCGDCVSVCPGIGATNASLEKSNGSDDIMQAWGPVLEIWEGYATDPDIRYQCSSGGIASALSLYCLEKIGMHGVLHTGDDVATPLKNKTWFSRSRTEILAKAGSRYLPASTCDGLYYVETAPQPCVFIGKPCDIAGLKKIQMRKTEVKNNVGLSIGIFCAGTPATQGTIDLMRNLNIDIEAVSEVRYRGRGWPGNFTVQLKEIDVRVRSLTYKEAWSFLQKYRPYRCYICPDGTSESADISCGDSWHRTSTEDEKGHSLVIVRTERGRAILHQAMAYGYLSLKRASFKMLEESQRNLHDKRSAIWGRLMAMKLFGVPTPRLLGFSLFSNWLGIPAYQKVRSLLGTGRRIIQRQYYKSLKSS